MRLLGKLGDELASIQDVASVQADRVRSATEFASQFDHLIVVLKVSSTVVTDGRRYFVNTTFNYPTMAEAYRVAALNGLNRLF